MTIPSFNPLHVLPPFTGPEPTDRYQISPYQTDIATVVATLGGTDERKKLLAGLLRYRTTLQSIGLTIRQQWLCGSFVENVEVARGRAPGDIDVVSFLERPISARTDNDFNDFVVANQILFNSRACKKSFDCDAYFVDLHAPAEAIVDDVTYWLGLFSHQRATYFWKGLVVVGPVDSGVEQTLLSSL